VSFGSAALSEPERKVDRSMSTTAVSRRGLASTEAAARLAAHGSNVVPGPRRVRLPTRILRQMRDPLIVVLLIAALLTVITGDYPDTAIIALVVVVNTVVGALQEVRADRAIAALTAMTTPTVRVRRDGVVTEIPAPGLVPGDVLLLGEGDVVPADAQVLDAAGLLVDESALTGESIAVTKDVTKDVAQDTAPAGGQGDGLWAGTVVVHGRAEAMVTATGADSATGRIAALMAAPATLTPLQQRLVGLGRVIAAVGAVLCLLVLAIGLANGRPVELMVVTAISLLVAAVPESLPAVVTLALALGARRMAARHAIARRLPAVETLGAITVLATDKTGTLTEGRMVVDMLWTPHGSATVRGQGYAPEGSIQVDGEAVSAGEDAHLEALLVAAVLCNDATLRAPGGPGEDWMPVGDPMEAALVATAARMGLDKTAFDLELPRVAEVSFDSERQRMTTVHRRPDGLWLVACKGAPEVVLDRVGAEPSVMAAAQAQADAYAAKGYRVLAVASAVLEPGATDADRLESGLSLNGLVALADPPRSAAAVTVARCRAAGIRPVLVTGDHASTAVAIARRIGLAHEGDAVATGSQIAAGDVPDLTAVRVLARTRPEQKVGVVEAWQRAGHVVAMTGDGVNDGPALRRADIGVAMGRRGTEVARQAADLVLSDDDLGTVIAAVEEGRRIYDNVRRFLLYGLAGGVAEVLVMLFGPALGLVVPLLPAQILWINLVTHGVPGVAMGAEPAEPDVLRRPPRPVGQHVLGDGLARRIGVLAVVVTATSLAVAVGARAADRPWQTMLFLTLACSQLAAAVGVRARTVGRTHRALFAGVAAAFAVQIAGVYLPALQDLLGTAPLDPEDLSIVLSVSAAGWLAARVLTRTGARPHLPAEDAAVGD
jgi:Ca2+-transporting ATPase